MPGDPNIKASLEQAIGLHKKGHISDASRLYEVLLLGSPDYPDLLYLSGLARLELGDVSVGADRMAKLITLQPGNAAALQALGKALLELGRPEEAAEKLARALELEPHRVDAAIMLARIAQDRHRLDKAEEILCHAVSVAPGDPRPLINLGNVMRELGRHAEAFNVWGSALELDPACEEARSNIAIQLAHKNDMASAISLLKEGLTHNPPSPDFLCLLGSLQLHHGRHDEAAGNLDLALGQRPDFPRASLLRAQAAVYLCEWDALDRAEPLIAAEIAAARNGQPCAVSPFFSLQLPTTGEERLAVARAASNNRMQSIAGMREKIGNRSSLTPKDRLHIGYLSSDWHDHPNGQAMCAAFQYHDRKSFEVTVLADSADDDSPCRRKISEGCDRMVDLTQFSDLEAAAEICRLGIDILVDVQGFTGTARSAIPALRPAPIQVLYQAFCGTSGSDWIDYLIVDRIVVPESSKSEFTEGLVYLPNCFMVGNNETPINGLGTTRAEEGLPLDGPVLSSFSNPYKITREIFSCWMRVLKSVPDAALWLNGGPAPMMDNLHRAAEKQGIDSARIVFASRMPDKADHLARHAHADLFLDTLIYGAHISALDSLWAGTPVLTCFGSTFTARVGASFLKNLGLDELVTQNIADYEALAIALANDPKRLSNLRARLKTGRDTYPLFDTAGWVADVERAYRAIWDACCTGDRPQVISLGELE